MFIAALFIIAKNMEATQLSIDRRLDKEALHRYNRTLCSHKTMKSCHLGPRRMDVEGPMLSKISQGRERQLPDFTYM